MQFDFACTSSLARPILLSTLRRITAKSLPPINSIKNLSYIASRRLQPTMGNNARHLKIEIEGVRTPSQLWFAAAQRKQYLAMKMVLSMGEISPNHTDCAGRAAQHNAALFNQVEMMQHLQTSLGCDHSLGDNNGDTPLHIAARFNCLKSAEFLINTAGVSSTVENNQGATPLLGACQEGHLSVVKLLLAQNGVDVDFQNIVGDTPLMRACAYGHLGVVECLLDAGADVNLVNHLNTAPLHLAIHNGNDEIIAALLEAGADANSPKGGHGSRRTPIQQAISQKANDIAWMLAVDYGADTTACVQRPRVT